MTDKYPKLRQDLAAAIADAKRQGGVNERAEQIAALLAERDTLAAAPVSAEPVAMPFGPISEDVRAALLFALWHHQGGSSGVGQPIRFMLGMGQHERMTPDQCDIARRVQSALSVSPEPVGILECNASGDGIFHPNERKVFMLPVGDYPLYAAPVAAQADLNPVEPTALDLSIRELEEWGASCDVYVTPSIGESIMLVLQELKRLRAAQAQDKPSGDEIDAIARAMPGGLNGFLEGWGWRQFARAVLERYGNLGAVGQQAAGTQPVDDRISLDFSIQPVSEALAAEQANKMPNAAHIALDSLDADAVYLLSRVKQGTMSLAEGAMVIRQRIEAARTSIVAAQPDVTQQTLDDVMAGIPARDAEIEALRKEIETLRAKQPVSCADGLADGEIDIADVRQYQQSWGCLAHPGVRALVDGYQSSTQPSGNSGELPDAARVPLDSLHADAVYLLSRVKQETLSIHDAALSIQHHIDSARAALAQQDAETGKSVSVENQGLTQQTSHHCDDACHEWRQERTPCPDGQCKVRNDAEAFKYWGGKETWVRYLTDHTGLIQITARDIATCNAALDAVKNALSPGAVQQDADKVKADLLSSLVEIVGAVIASDEEGLIEHSETIIKARAAIDSARKEQA